MNVDIVKLRTILERTKLGCGEGHVVQWLGHIGFKEGRGTVWNSVFGIIFKDALEGEFSVNHDRLLGIAKSYKDKDANCYIENGKMILKSKKQTATILIATLEDFTFPRAEEFIEKPIDPALLQALEIVSSAIPEKLTGVSNFCGVSFGVTDDYSRVLAYDGKRYAFAKLDMELPAPFILHKKVVDAILKLGQPNAFGVGKQYIYFIYDDIILFTRPVDAMEARLPASFWNPDVVLYEVPEGVQEFVKNASVLGADSITYSAERHQLKATEMHGDSITLDIELQGFRDFKASTEIMQDALNYALQWGVMQSPNTSTVLAFKPALQGYIYVSGQRED